VLARLPAAPEIANACSQEAGLAQPESPTDEVVQVLE
jgi:hypothetical protein